MILGGTFITFFLLVIGLNLWSDPFFILNHSKIDPQHTSIDNKQRYAKSLQVIARQPKIVLLGSSRVYRGFDVKNDFYNMGISSLKLKEAASYTDHILHFTSAHPLILGLDFWMCDEAAPTLPGWNEKIGTIPYVIKAFIDMLFSTEESLDILKNYLLKKKPTSFEEGWTYGGFFRTPKRSKLEVEDLLCSYEKAYYETRISLGMLNFLKDIIHKCQTHRVKLYVYISPLHPRTKDIYKKSSNWSYFERWRENVEFICKTNNISFQDFSNLFHDSPPLLEGSNDLWLDYSHFSPKVGNIILKKLGII